MQTLNKENFRNEVQAKYPQACQQIIKAFPGQVKKFFIDLQTNIINSATKLN